MFEQVPGEEIGGADPAVDLTVVYTLKQLEHYQVQIDGQEWASPLFGLRVLWRGHSRGVFGQKRKAQWGLGAPNIRAAAQRVQVLVREQHHP